LPENRKVRQQAIIGRSFRQNSRRALEFDRLQREKSIENVGLDDVRGILWIRG
jgi:hypothetical protein